MSLPKTVVLGWGSLLWDPRTLPVSTPWRPDGPRLPIEFCRVAANGRLTLAIDHSYGVPVRTWWAGLDVDDGEQALISLAEREGCTVSNIGALDQTRGTPTVANDHQEVAPTIEPWARTLGVRHVVWTALTTNFSERVGRPFSIETALQYVRQRRGRTRDLAFEYLRRAPASTATPVRAAFTRELDGLRVDTIKASEGGA